MSVHLGTRVSALLDGRLAPEEEERAWAHVHACHPCRDLVEREGWVKTRLAELSLGPASASERLKSSLLDATPPAPCPDEDCWSRPAPRPRHRGLVAVGGGAASAAMVGVLALAIGPVSTQVDRRAPRTDLPRPTPAVQDSRVPLSIGPRIPVVPIGVSVPVPTQVPTSAGSAPSAVTGSTLRGTRLARPDSTP